MTSCHSDELGSFRPRSYSGGRLSYRAKYTRTRLFLKSSSSAKSIEKQSAPSQKKADNITISTALSATNDQKVVCLDSDEDDTDCTGCMSGIFSLDSTRIRNFTTSRSCHTLGQSDRASPADGSIFCSTQSTHRCNASSSSNNSTGDIAGRRRVLSHMHHLVRKMIG